MTALAGLIMAAGACGAAPEAPAPAPASEPASEPASKDKGPAEGAGPAPKTARAETQHTAPVVVMLGDSLTAGFGLAQADALPAQLERTLAARGVAAQFVNAGVSGDTTGGGLERYDWSVKGAGADLLVVALGANDYLQGKSVAAARENLRKILQRARADGLPVALIGLAPRSNGAVSQRDAAFADIYPALAVEFSAPLYPALLSGVRDQPSLMQSDGLHPTRDGVATIAAAMAGFLETEINALPERRAAPGKEQ
ncbi:MAG: arylesterase [Pseudomonadota bacterium]